MIHFFLLVFVFILWLGAWFFYQKGETFLQFLHGNEEADYQSKKMQLVWLQVISGIAGLIIFMIDQPLFDLIYLAVVLIAYAVMSLLLVKK